MRASLSALSITAGLLCFALATQPLSSDSASQDIGAGSIYIAHVTVIDTESGKESPDQTVAISGDRISEVKASKEIHPQTGTKVVDGTGKFLIPGLRDMHVHAFTFSEGATGSVTTMPPESYFRLAIANGVTGFRDMGGPETAEDLAKLRKVSLDGSALVPKIFAADLFWMDQSQYGRIRSLFGLYKMREMRCGRSNQRALISSKSMMAFRGTRLRA